MFGRRLPKINISLSIFLCGLTFASNVRAEPLIKLVAEQVQKLDYVFIAPNEKHPQNSRDILAQAPDGVLVSVGTERGFISASLGAGIDHLIQLDSSFEVVAYNQINAVLLALSRTREDYLFLRFQADHSRWVSRLASSAFDNPMYRKILSSTHWDAWNRDVRAAKSHDYSDFHRRWDGQKKPCHDCFSGANYLFDDVLYTKLAEMAKAGNIEAHFADFGRVNYIESMFRDMTATGKKISILDLSNAWEPQYLTTEKLARLLETIKPYVHPKAILLLSRMNNVHQSFDYFGFDFRLIAQFSSTLEFLKVHVPSNRNIQGLQNGVASIPSCLKLQSATTSFKGY